MKRFVICIALFCTAFCLYGVANRLGEADLTVHEWGTFTSVAGSDGAPVSWNVLGCGSDLPRFVKTVIYKNAMAARVRMETPVLYFYSRQDFDASVKVSLPGGTITDFYPNGTSSGGGLEWKSIRIEPAGAPEFPVESAPSRYYAARATDAAPLTVGDQHEKFLFYRGTGNMSIPLSARVADDGRVTVTDTDKDAVPVVMLFENRGGVIGYRNAGKVEMDEVLERPALDKTSVAPIKADIEAALIAQGLYPKEAAAMIDTWHDSWFEEGSRLIYILPESAVNRMVQLAINPAPAHISRVFVGRIELISPETKHAVSEAVAENDTHTLALYQRFLAPIGRRLGTAVDLPCEATKISNSVARALGRLDYIDVDKASSRP